MVPPRGSLEGTHDHPPIPRLGPSHTHSAHTRTVVVTFLCGPSSTEQPTVMTHQIHPQGARMSYPVDFEHVSTAGLESSPVAAALAGLRANEARYFKNKYSHVFTVQPAAEAVEVVDW